MISAKEVTGGFIARTMIVEEHKRALKNPLLDKPKHVIDVPRLAGHLKKLATLEGEFKWAPEAKEIYREWYMAYNPEDHEDKTGTANRIHDQILKVAMLLSLARGTDLTISTEDIRMATKACGRFEKTARSVTSGHGGTSEFGPKIKLVIDELISSPTNRIKRSTFLSKHYGDIDAFDLDRCIATMAQAKAVEEKKVAGDVIYIATPLLLKQYEATKEK
jgi:hypothetical protein